MLELCLRNSWVQFYQVGPVRSWEVLLKLIYVYVKYNILKFLPGTVYSEENPKNKSEVIKKVK